MIMKKTTLLLLAFSVNVFAAKIIFTNNNEQTEIDGNASIDIQTGNVLVETTTPKLIVGGDALLSLFPSTYEVNLNQTIQMNYTIANGENCVGTTNRGSVSNWTNSLNSNNGTHTVSVNAGSLLPIVFTIDCDNKVDSFGVTDSVTIIRRADTGPGVTPSVTVRANGSASNTSVTQGSQVALSYLITDNDLPCTFTSSPINSAWNNLNSSSSSTADLMATINSTSTFSISCTNSDGNSDSDSISISVIGNPACASHPSPPGTTGINATYASLNDSGEIFGEAHAEQATFGIDENKYYSISFSAPNGSKQVELGFENAEANFTTAPYSVSVSKCPGDFNVTGATNTGGSDVGRGLCKKSGGAFTLRTITTTSPTPLEEALSCILEAGQPYYLNIIHSNSAPYSSTSCNDNGNPAECGVLYVERSQFTKK